MDINEIITNLCSYDKRNPNNVLDEGEDTVVKQPCYCDNCFYGRTVLANELLKLIQRYENGTNLHMV